MMKCKVCGGQLHIKFPNQKDINFGATKKLFDWLKCENCSLYSIQLSPDTPAEEDLVNYYSNYIPHQGKINITPLSETRDKVSINIMFLKKHFSEDSSFRLIDLGCGSGQMLANLIHYFPNSQLYGLDYNIKPAKENLKQKSINLIAGDLFSLDENLKFDVIVSSQFLEHIENPQDYTEFIKKHAADDCYILTDIPNIESQSFRLFQSSWVHLDTPRHRNLFSRKSLDILFKDYEFVDFVKFGTNYAFISSLKLKYNIPIHGKSLFTKIINYMLNLVLGLFVKPDDKIHFIVHIKSELSKHKS